MPSQLAYSSPAGAKSVCGVSCVRDGKTWAPMTRVVHRYMVSQAFVFPCKPAYPALGA